jgi:anti-sigma factor RsiW
MTACPRFESALLDRAAGVLDPETLAELEEHMKACPACASEAKALKDALDLASLPPLTPREQMKLSALPSSTLRAWRAGEKRRQITWGAALGAGIAAAAAAAIVILPMRLRPTNRVQVRVESSRSADDVTALENWGMGDWLVELSADTASSTDALEGGGDDEGVDW